MNMLKPLMMLVLGSTILGGCGAREDDSSAQTEAPAPAAEAPVDETAPADTTGVAPSDEADPAMSDSLPTAEEPPPPEPSPPGG
jgi:hypothetical protein